MAAEIVIEVELGGEVKVDAVGFTGAACDRATESYERALGGKAKKTLKPEHAQVERERRTA